MWMQGSLPVGSLTWLRLGGDLRKTAVKEISRGYRHQILCVFNIFTLLGLASFLISNSKVNVPGPGSHFMVRRVEVYLGGGHGGQRCLPHCVKTVTSIPGSLSVCCLGARPSETPRLAPMSWEDHLKQTYSRPHTVVHMQIATCAISCSSLHK
ncbi:Uncharacterized protein M6B38_226265 [Iris pallida]|uniref:Uncharacterized protein n=1 Tax=Iris pallida TaxID=29817 RepID=A0AAX6DUH5_IRIPA|nr:Uncharacterized protein M6B38_226265 [Iris pallida]